VGPIDVTQEIPTVDKLMEKNVLAVQLNATASDCARAMSKRGVSGAVVMEGGAAVGIVTERDLVSKVIGDELDPKKVLVRDIMSTPLITVAEDAPITEAAKLMAQYRIRRLVVNGNHGELRGIVTTGDIARWLAQKQNFGDATFNAMARYSAGLEGGPYQ
jgi:CBS domain-containing protein